ncbi:hypothetical protein [Microbacterium invictum]|uniref:DUF2127 domain-containing protein n=1 Tax=Microbacterium invictum TaxID=515415 RepID=A0ABZ0V9M9_9MICO|nr:hypothetical protein [Microbacterium invictum]WQB70041.1 hypothetical protein T9R20_15290 [Microbacterium invictum]
MKSTDHPKKRVAFEPAERLLQPTGYDPGMKRPPSIVAGALLVVLGVLAGVAWVIASSGVWPEWVGEVAAIIGGDDVPDRVEQSTYLLFAVLSGLFLAVEATLALLVFLGVNWARVLVMVFAALTISAAFVRWWVEDQEIEITTTFISLGIDILILLALSSRSAAAYARRRER